MELVTEKLRLTPEEVLGQCAPAWLGLESRLAIKIARWEDKCVTLCSLRNRLLGSQVTCSFCIQWECFSKVSSSA